MVFYMGESCLDLRLLESLDNDEKTFGCLYRRYRGASDPVPMLEIAVARPSDDRLSVVWKGEWDSDSLRILNGGRAFE